jgi:hypothetical protein
MTDKGSGIPGGIARQITVLVMYVNIVPDNGLPQLNKENRLLLIAVLNIKYK